MTLSARKLAQLSLAHVKGKVHVANYMLKAPLSDQDLESALHFIQEAEEELAKARSFIALEITDRKENK